jgi:hypothetical protein
MDLDSPALENAAARGEEQAMRWGISRSNVILMIVFLLAMGGMAWRILCVQPDLTLSGFEERGASEGEGEVSPSIVVDHLNLAHSRGGMKERILKFERAWQQQGPRGLVYEVEKPRVLMARIREMSFTLEADGGWFHPASGNVHLAGNVHAASGTEREFFADSADYYAREDHLIARGKEKPLRVIERGSVIEARVLRTDGRFESIEFLEAEGEVGMDMIQPEGWEQTDENN